MEALLNNKMHYKEDVNKLRPCDDKREFGDLALLHRLVVVPYTHQIDLLLSLITFSGADIDHRTSNGHTAFQLAVVVCAANCSTLLYRHECSNGSWICINEYCYVCYSGHIWTST